MLYFYLVYYKYTYGITVTATTKIEKIEISTQDLFGHARSTKTGVWLHRLQRWPAELYPDYQELWCLEARVVSFWGVAQPVIAMDVSHYVPRAALV